MKTVLKFPVYVEVETENLDRGKVSSEARKMLFPHLLEYLASAKYKKSVLEKLSKTLGSPISIQLLTDFEVLRKAGLINTGSHSLDE